MAGAYGHYIEHMAGQATYWHAQSAYSDTTIYEDVSGVAGCSFVTLGFSRTVPVGTREDYATMTLAIGKVPVTGQWTFLGGADKALAEASLDTFWTSLKALVSPAFTLKEYRWHDWLLVDDKLGPADRVTARTVAGTGVAGHRLPDQDSSTVTFKTASRKHWGRVYLPGLEYGNLDLTYGRWINTAIDLWTSYMHTLQANLISNSQEIVVASRRYRGLLSVSAIASDDVVDIVRRRRAKQASYRKEYTS